jgi:benzoate membrane transport protein
VSLLGIGPAFWGLVAGGVVLLLYRRPEKRSAPVDRAD